MNRYRRTLVCHSERKRRTCFHREEICQHFRNTPVNSLGVLLRLGSFRRCTLSYISSGIFDREASLPRPASAPDLAQQMTQTYALNDQMNQLLLEHLDARAWKAKPPGRGARTIPAIFAHVHNIRCKWLRLSAPHLKLPAQLDRSRCTQKQASTALAESAATCCEMLAEALRIPAGLAAVPSASAPATRVQYFLRDGWAQPWQPSAAMLAYMIGHDFHHRGQICMLAHQLGFPLPPQITARMWSWETLSKKCGFTIAGPKKSRSREGRRKPADIQRGPKKT